MKRSGEDRTYLALDLGAESGRAILAHLAGHTIELQEVHRFKNLPVQLPTGLYWNTLGLFRELCVGLQAAAKNSDSLDGIGVDTWGVDFGLLGPDKCLLDNPRHYRDARTAGSMMNAATKLPVDEIFRQTGVQFMEINTLYQLYAMQRDSPHVLKAAEHLLFMPDLFNYFLTGAIATERTIASTSQLYNPVTQQFATDLLTALEVSPHFLTKLVNPGTPLAPLLPFLSEGWGLNNQPTVYNVGSHDTASAVAAVPARGEDWCYISSGTWSLMGVELNQPLITDASLAANFTNEVGVGNRIRFLKNIPGMWVLQECRRAWEMSGQDIGYSELLQAAEAAKPSETVLDLDQFASPGNHPARIIQYCKDTQQQAPEGMGETVRVVLHSIATRYLEVLERLEALTNRRIKVIHIVGGGSRNTLLNQMAANVTGRLVIAGPAEATAAGNALTQALGAGRIGSLEELRAVVRQSFEVSEFQPQSLD